MKILSFLASLFTSGASGLNGAGNAVVNVATIAALTPAALWVIAHKDVIALQISYGWLAIGALGFAGVIKLAHVLRRGSSDDRTS